MGFDFWFTAAVLVLMSAALLREWLSTEIIIFSSLLALMLGGVIDIRTAISGFSNEGMLSIALLFIMAGALQSTGLVRKISTSLFGSSERSMSYTLSRVLFPVAGFSAFINNTPLVAILIPALRSWAERTGAASSKLLIPVSFAAILGGMCTLIGTSTNLIIYGLMLDFGMPGLKMFELAPIGIPIALVGLFYLIFYGHRRLPDHREFIESVGEDTREFVIELKVANEYAHVGKTIEQAGLRHLNGLFLFQIERNGRVIAPARPDGLILPGDRLYFTGLPKTILELQKTPGLELLKDSHFDLKQYDSSMIRPYEAVISKSSPLVGKNVRRSNFRAQYDAVIVAIHRNGERMRRKIGDIVLQEGDTLLLLAHKGFQKKWYHSRDFYLISESEPIGSRPRWQGILTIGLMLTMIALVVSGAMNIFPAAALAVVALLLTGTITREEAQASIDVRVLLIIASAFGIAEAMQASGLADTLARGVIAVGSVFGVPGVMAGIFLVASLYTNVMTNNATAALVFPVAFSVAGEMGLDPRPFILTLTIAASTSFMTPISYQTNLMVMGPGRYHTSDFLRVGIPLQVIVSILGIGLIYWMYF